MIATWGIVLASACVCFAPALLIAPLLIWSWGAYLRHRLGGITGDCLGAGIEITEIALLATLAAGAAFHPFSALVSM
jgi:adenosylcobinamide-GDP ribazoletransferase